MNYKGLTIDGMRGCGFTVVYANVVWTFGRLKAAQAFIDEKVQA